MSRPNKCIKDENGNDQWISRSTVVIPVVFKMDREGYIYTLVEKRGTVVSHPGEWCCPCGYLDWDETLEEACLREVREETGLELDMRNIHLFDVNSNPQSTNQTVDLGYMCWAIEGDFDMSKVETKDEILDLKWLKVARMYFMDAATSSGKEIHHMDIYKKSIEDGYGTWAFKTHAPRIIKMLKTILDSDKVEEIND